MIEIVPPAGFQEQQADASPTPAISPQAAHLCLDMQNLIGPAGPWAAEWAERVMPAIVSLVEHAPERCIFTRFMPPMDASAMPGAWRTFYAKWSGLTGKAVDPAALELMAPLKLFTPPARVLDKTRYSAFSNSLLLDWLRQMEADALIVSGAETDVCVLATVLAAVDLGLPVIIATDAVCSGSDPCHDAVLQLYHLRFSQQMQAMPVAQIRSLWTPKG